MWKYPVNGFSDNIYLSDHQMIRWKDGNHVGLWTCLLQTDNPPSSGNLGDSVFDYVVYQAQWVGYAFVKIIYWPYDAEHV